MSAWKPSYRHLVQWTALFGLLTPAPALAQSWGRDFVPGDEASSPDPTWQVSSSGGVHNTLLFGGEIYVYYGLSGDIEVAKFDWGTEQLGTGSVVLSRTAGSENEDALQSSAVAICAKQTATDETLTLISGALYAMTHIGVVPGSITVSGSGGSCPDLAVTAGSYQEGYDDGSAHESAIELESRGTCTGFTASFDYTECSLSGDDRFRCGADHGVDGLGDEYCRFFMIYEGIQDPGTPSDATDDDRRFFLAHAQDPDDTFREYDFTSCSPCPSADDAVLVNTSEHECDGSSGVRSFVSVPDVLWDAGNDVHRMWFVTEDYQDASVRYSESDDDGQSWGITSSAQPQDCWDDTGGAFDTSACTNLAWSSGNSAPDYTGTSEVCAADQRAPDFVDPDIYKIGTSTWAMMGAGTYDDGSCEEWGVVLYNEHTAAGDQSGGAKWAWVSNVQNDASYGVIVENDVSSSCATSNTLDPTVVEWDTDQYLMFYNSSYPSNGINLAGSGFECSDFSDNDSAGGTDWPNDLDCGSPVDDAE